MNPVAIAQLDTVFSMNSVWMVTKLLYLVAFLVYIGFAVVVISQVQQMARTITTGFESPLKLLSWLHLGGAILALLWAFMIL
jgi:hypothetical protein